MTTRNWFWFMRGPQWVALTVACLFGLAGCDDLDSPAEHKGEIVLALQGDMSFPDDLDRVTVEASIEGKVVLDKEFLIEPDGKIALPSIIRVGLGYRPGSDLSVTVFGYQGDTPRIHAYVETTVPDDREALLHLPLQWLCRGDEGDSRSDLSKDCNTGQTCRAGSCQSANIAVRVLPDYDPKDVYGGASKPGSARGECFNTQGCFDNGVDIVPDANCRVHYDVPDGSEPNFGLTMAKGEGGIEGENGSYIPLNKSDDYGWKERGRETRDGDIERVRAQLPLSVCEELEAGTISAIRASSACATKTLSRPTCGPWSSVTGISVVVTVASLDPELDAGPAEEPEAPVGDDDDDMSPTDAGSPLEGLSIFLNGGGLTDPLGVGISVNLSVPGIDDGEGSWSSDDSDVVSVTNSGELTTHGPGDALITFEYQGFVLTLRVYVNAGIGVSLRPGAALLQLEVTPELTSLLVGDESQVEVLATFDDDSTDDVTDEIEWTTENEDVAIVDETGMVMAVGPGSTRVVASYGDVSGEARVVVSALAEVEPDVVVDPDPEEMVEELPPTLTNIAVTGGTVRVAESLQLTATATYSDNTQQDVTALADWTSLNASLASVSAGGYLTGVAIGGATIEAAWEGFASTASVLVTAPILIGVELATVESAIPAGYTYQMVAWGTYADGSSTELTDDLVWSSNETAVATIDDDGLVSALAVGSSEITVSVLDTDFSATETVTVSDAVAEQLVIEAQAPVPSGLSAQLQASLIFSDGTRLDVSASSVWAAQDSGVVTVAEGGAALALTPGSTEVTASLDARVATLQFVTIAAVPASLAISPPGRTLPARVSRAFSATVTLTDGSTQVVTGDSEWSSSDDSVVSVSASAVVTTIAAGSITLTATYQGLSGTARVHVNETVVDTGPQLMEIVVLADGEGYYGGGEGGYYFPVESSYPFVALAFYDDESTVNVTNLAAWSSSDPDVVTVDYTGRAYFNDNGEVMLTALYDGVSGSISVISGSGITPVGLTLTPTSSSLVLGDSVQLTATLLFSDESTQVVTEHQSLSWEVDSESGITLDAGKATPLGADAEQGVFVSWNGGEFTAIAVLNVSPRQELELLVEVNVLEIGQSEQVFVNLLTIFGPSDNDIERTSLSDNVTLTWSSVTPDAVNVSATGLVSTATSLGFFDVEATYEPPNSQPISGSVTFEVIPAWLLDPASINVSLRSVTRINDISLDAGEGFFSVLSDVLTRGEHDFFEVFLDDGGYSIGGLSIGAGSLPLQYTIDGKVYEKSLPVAVTAGTVQ